jgi:glycosyltransferase involved in cell wall biosynthesis
MNVWIFQTGEPLHIDKNNPRPMRAMNLSNKLVEAGHSVVIWSSAFSHQGKYHRSTEFEVHQVRKNLEIRLISSCGYKRHIGLGRLIDHAQLAWNLKQLLIQEKNKPDVAFVGYPPIEAAFVMTNWLKNNQIPVMLDVKDLWPSMFVDAFPKILQPFARIIFHPYFYLAKRTINDVSSVSAMAPSFLSWVLNFAKKEKTALDRVFRLTSQGGQVNNMELMEATKWWNNLGVDNKSPKIFFVGSFMSVFDFQPVLEAARKMNNCQFVLCGEGDYLDGVKADMDGLNNVLFPGWIDRPKIESLAMMSLASLAPYKNIDNFIVNTPNKIVDSILLGLPILSPLKGEVATLIKDHNVGFTYDEDLPLSDCINNLIIDDKLQKKMSSNAKKLYDDEFEFNKVYDGLVHHLEYMANK